MTEIAAPVVAGLGLVDDAAKARIDEVVLEGVRSFEVDGKPCNPLHTRCVSGTR